MSFLKRLANKIKQKRMAEQQQMAPSQPMGMFGMSADALKGMGGTPQPSRGGGFFGSLDDSFKQHKLRDQIDALLAEQQQRFDPRVQPGDDRSGFDPRSLSPIGGGGFPPSLPDRPLPPSIVRPGELPGTPSRPFPFGPGHPLFDPPRGNRGGVSGIRPIRPKSKGGLGSIYQKFFDRRRSGNMPMQDMPAVPMPNQGFDLGIELDRVPFERPGFAEGDEVRSGRRPGTTGPRVQNISNQVLKNRPPVGNIVSGALGRAAMSPVSKFGIPGAIAAGGYALAQIAQETGFVPEDIGRGAAKVDKGFQEVVDEAAGIASELGESIGEFVGRVVQGYESEMDESDKLGKMMMRGQGINTREILGESGRTIPNRDLEMLSPRNILGESGRNISNLDRSMMPMFAKGLDVDIANLQKKN